MELTDQKVIEFLEMRDLLLQEYADARQKFMAAKENLQCHNLFISEIIGVNDFIHFGSDKFKLRYEAKELAV